MNSDTRNFYLGATWLLILVTIAAFVIYGLIWTNSYMQFDHVHNHSHRAHEHPHEHAKHEHPHEIPKHEHPHAHVISKANAVGS